MVEHLGWETFEHGRQPVHLLKVSDRIVLTVHLNEDCRLLRHFYELVWNSYKSRISAPQTHERGGAHGYFGVFGAVVEPRF